MKLISLNVEGLRHNKTVCSFLVHENADVICLQEATEIHVKYLKNLHYHVTFLPRCTRTQDGTTFSDGQLIATKVPHTTENHYYHTQDTDLPFEIYDPAKNRHTCNQGIIVCTLTSKGTVFTIVTTHFTWAPDGDTATTAQENDLQALLAYTDTLPPHILCGDFNIPRNINTLYNKLTDTYTDTIPAKYTHSLDPVLHRLSTNPEKKHLITKYMVDYIFSQSPYSVERVRLEFGISDHAAVVADIATNKTSPKG